MYNAVLVSGVQYSDSAIPYSGLIVVSVLLIPFTYFIHLLTHLPLETISLFSIVKGLFFG